MDISFIFLSLLAVLCVLSLICAVYFFLYKRHINKALAAPETKHMKLVPPYKILVALVLAFIIVGVCFAITMLPSMKRLSTVSDIEKDIILRQKNEGQKNANRGKAQKSSMGFSVPR